MTPGLMRALERWLGRPLCAALTLHRRLAGARRAPDAAPPRRVAFIKLIEQGSTVLAHAAIGRAVRMVGRENVFWCVFAENAEVLDVLGLLPAENVLVIRGDGLVNLIGDTLRCVRRMRRLGIDATVDLEHFARAPAILAYLAGARIRVGLHGFEAETPYRGDLMTHRVPFNPYAHTALTFDLLARALDGDPSSVPMLKEPLGAAGAPPRFAPRDDEQAAVAALLAPAGASRGPLVILNPNAHDRLPLRKWPTERFAELGRRLLATAPAVTLAITGTAAERAGAEALRQAIDSRVLNLAGRTTLREAIALYGMAAVVVTNDSGPAHFATLTGTAVVALFGPETPQLYGPLGDRAEALWAGLACSPCVNAFNQRVSPCTDNVCMRALSVDQVLAAVQRHLRTG